MYKTVQEIYLLHGADKIICILPVNIKDQDVLEYYGREKVNF